MNYSFKMILQIEAHSATEVHLEQLHNFADVEEFP